MRTIALFAKNLKPQLTTQTPAKKHSLKQGAHRVTIKSQPHPQIRTNISQAFPSKKRPSNLYSKNHYMYPTGKAHKNQTKPITNGKSLRPSYSSQKRDNKSPR